MRNLIFILLLVISFAQQSQAQPEPFRCSKTFTFLNQKQLRTTVSTNILQRLEQYDVHYYKLDISAERTTSAIVGHTTLQATVIHGPLTNFVFELSHEMTIDSLRFNGSLLSFTRTDTFVTVTLPTPLPIASDIKADIYYSGTPNGGLGNGTEPFGNESITWSLSEPYNAYHWFAVKQILADKADSSEVWVTTSDENKVGSNGLLKNITVLPGNKNRYEWKSNYPIAYYLISFTLGKFVDYTLYANPIGATQPVPVISYIYAHPDAMTSFKPGLDEVPQMIEVYSSVFGLYPFHKEKYGHCTAPIGGGMEHQTMTTLTDFVTKLASHELAHQWFGDQVTCGSWKDIWLNEGFASYAEYLYLQATGQNVQDWLNVAYTQALEIPAGSVYVDDTTDVNRVFNYDLTYEKGALLLHMLRYAIQDDALFFQGLKNYQQTFQYKTATTTDFKNSMEATTAMDFDVFFNQWFLGSGYPILSATWNHTANGNFYLQTTQVGSDPSVTPLYVTSVDCHLSRSGVADTLIHISIDQTTNQFIIPHVQGTVLNITLDPDRWLLHKVDQIIHDTNLIITSNSHQEEAQTISLYPNPAETEIQLSMPSTYKDSAKLYNAQGKELQSFALDGQTLALRTDLLSPGLYLIVLQEGKRTIPFIKK